MWFKAQQAGRIGNMGWGLGRAKPSPRKRSRKIVVPSHVGVRLTFAWSIAEVSPAIDHLLGRPSVDAQLKATARDQIGCAGVLGHVKRVPVAHIDHRRAYFDAAGFLKA
jgi:hypothetical protein